ncbi:MAG: glycosyltransferase family 4 protein [Xanthomonadaceae bacterium]|nr:glycosyltransferase family 4 protein [Xanthomonadaceae bacterium]
MSARRCMLFHRDFRAFTGGHGKVYDWYTHVATHRNWQASIYFTPESRRDDDNPWIAAGIASVVKWQPAQTHALFLAGNDWQAAVDASPVPPVINLIQGIRHADPSHVSNGYLSRPAVRVCVSAMVADALRASGRVRGPIEVIEAGIDVVALAALGDAAPARQTVLVDAIKQPALGTAAAAHLAAHGVAHTLLQSPLPRADYRRLLAQHAVCLLLPMTTEGFYLPALEAMAIGRAVVVPDAVGNRAYLESGRNALVPNPQPRDLATAAIDLMHNAAHRAVMAGAGRITAQRFTLERERAAAHALLDRIDALWASL